MYPYHNTNLQGRDVDIHVIHFELHFESRVHNADSKSTLHEMCNVDSKSTLHEM